MLKTSLIAFLRYELFYDAQNKLSLGDTWDDVRS